MSWLDTREAANRQADRLFASASITEPTSRPGEEPGDEMTVIREPDIHGRLWYLSIGPADIQAVIDELRAGAPCGICHRPRCRLGDDA